MDTTGWQRGDRPTLAARAELALPAVWALTRGGFVHTAEGRVHVFGVEHGDRAEKLAAQILAEALAPAARAAHAPDGPAWDGLLLRTAASTLEEHARARGGMVTLGEGREAPAVIDLDRPEGLADVAAPALDVDAQARAAAILEGVAELELDATDAAIVERRWRLGEPREAVARALGVSARRVAAREGVIRRHLRHRAALRVDRPASLIDLDLALAGETARHRLTTPSRERIIDATLSRVDVTPPRPTAVRLAWAAGALALGLVLFLAMLLDLLPSPADDAVLTPSVRVVCDGGCAPGAQAAVLVTAPRSARRVAVVLIDERGAPLAWVADAVGRSIALPSRARHAEVPLPRALRLPDAGRELRAVAVFSKRRLDRAELLTAAMGEPPQGAYAAWSTVTVE